jgi:osmotically-inducible protein OsmY
MINKSNKLVLASSIAVLAFGVMSSSGVFAASTAQDVVEARQESQIWTTFALSPYLRANNLNVTVHNGKATLTGKVEEEINKDLAKQIALGVNGVKEVDNQIVVEANYVHPERSVDRTYGEVIDDATITSAVKSKLMWSKHADGLATNVDTKLGKVVLQGTAKTAEAKELAGRLAANTRGVLSVDNQLVVDTSKTTATDKAKSSVKEVGKDISDSWITTKVKSTFLYSTHVDGSGIKVSTNKGVVTLTGKVGSSVERLQAIDLAKGLRGVKSVDAKGLTL